MGRIIYPFSLTYKISWIQCTFMDFLKFGDLSDLLFLFFFISIVFSGIYLTFLHMYLFSKYYFILFNLFKFSCISIYFLEFILSFFLNLFGFYLNFMYFLNFYIFSEFNWNFPWIFIYFLQFTWIFWILSEIIGIFPEFWWIYWCWELLTKLWLSLRSHNASSLNYKTSFACPCQRHGANVSPY